MITVKAIIIIILLEITLEVLYLYCSSECKLTEIIYKKAGCKCIMFHKELAAPQCNLWLPQQQLFQRPNSCFLFREQRWTGSKGNKILSSTNSFKTNKPHFQEKWYLYFIFWSLGLGLYYFFQSRVCCPCVI